MNAPAVEGDLDTVFDAMYDDGSVFLYVIPRGLEPGFGTNMGCGEPVRNAVLGMNNKARSIDPGIPDRLALISNAGSE
jgi:hypothetical protein